MLRGFRYFKKGIFLCTLVFLCITYVYGQSNAPDKAKDAASIEKKSTVTDSRKSTAAKKTIDVNDNNAPETGKKRVSDKSDAANDKEANTGSTDITNTSGAIKKNPGKSVVAKEKKELSTKRSKAAVAREKRKKINKASVKKSVKENKTKTAETKLNSNTSVMPSLMHVSSKEYRYDRIPGIVLEKREPVAEESIVKIEEEKSSTVDTAEKEEGGLIGLGPTITKISIVILIFIVFVLYKLRSKHSRSGVVKSYRRN